LYLDLTDSHTTIGFIKIDRKKSSNYLLKIHEHYNALILDQEKNEA